MQNISWKSYLLAIVAIFMLAISFSVRSECISCHEGIEDIRESDSSMMLQIKAIGVANGDNQGCIVCHGGNPAATSVEEAHKGAVSSLANGPDAFYPDPGSIWIADKTCGQCHQEYVYRVERSLMNTEAGKIQGNLHTFGLPEVQSHNVPWGNYDVVDDDGSEPSIGTPEYKEYMVALMGMYEKQFPSELKRLPDVSVEQVEKDPKLAGVTYQKQQCQRCHVGVKGRERRGDYRGMGCSSCHILYGNEGFYEGNDKTISKDEPGHMLQHKIYGTREAGNGIPVESCNSCHNRGKRIGVSYQGLMEFPYGSPYNENGGKQPGLHTKNYLFIADDLHHQIESREGNPQGGLLCQDCHTTIDMHGDGNIAGTTLAQVEIECQDCHGTPDKFPWELPIGYSEEFNRDIGQKPRGLSDDLLPETLFGTVYDKKEGYLKTARGNPFGNIVKDGDKVILHSASGNDFEIPVLKQLSITDNWKNEHAKVAMEQISQHNETLECYTCHSSWVPQCYGCHVQVNYGTDENGNPYQDTDWVASGNSVDESGLTADARGEAVKIPGKVFESRSYLRWETPILGINGEGRITPLMPGCQVIYTVIDKDGNAIALNETASAPSEAKDISQSKIPSAVDMAPVQPHTVQRKARSCESCHNSPKTQGFGIEGGAFMFRNNEDVIVDLMDIKTGEVIPENHVIQSSKMNGIDFDLSTIINEKGEQVQTVGSHWPLSRALTQDIIDSMDRVGLCIGCHKETSNEALWKEVSTPGQISDEEHTELMNKMLKRYGE